MIEEVVREGGAGEKLLAMMAERQITAGSLIFALPETVPHGDRLSLEKLCGIDDDTIVRRVAEARGSGHGR